ncbi:d76367ca-9a81-478a-a1ba-34bd5534e311 [Sclerotinia trifoliorum]|uniref:Autophagy-related protein 11 n=1 Tax=Sclerotinia trifoliorum TaxID=28548 RepID=A0A8H2ZQU4_9HELO|nr:d76367ca-9a81-478a-a1ba-34bd5534e311 [Sclerotinia trifoliorum]
MELHVYIAHTGQHLQVDPGSFTSLDDFKKWVAKYTPIAASDHISLTAAAKAVRFQALSSEQEIFVYDRRIIQQSSIASAKSLISEIPLPRKYTVSQTPDSITNEKNLQTWKDLFAERRAWAVKVVDDCAAMSDQAQQRYIETEVITRCVDTAVLNLEKHIKALDQKNAEVQNDVEEMQKLNTTNGDWEASISRLKSLPASADVIKFITGRDLSKMQRPITLGDLIDAEEVKRSGKLLRNISTNLEQKSVEVGQDVDEVMRRIDLLIEKVEKSPARAAIPHAQEPISLMEDIEAISKKVNTDCETVLGFANTPKNISQASKSALLHTEKFLPSLSKRALEMEGMVQAVTKLRNSTAISSLEFMYDIASLTTMLAEVNSRFAALELDGDVIDALHMISMLDTLPVTYASFLAEAVRRSEWDEKVKSDSSTLANEMANFQEEETRRRRKWQKNIGATLWEEKPERQVMALEVILHGEKDDWPQASRRDLEEILEILKADDPQSPIVGEISRIISDLNNPTRQQSRRANAFKAGSIHESALGKSALLMRGDNDVLKSLQDDKLKLENKLKTAESRVRRLEDLYHRQTQVSRTSSGNVFPVPNNPSPDVHNVANPMASPRLNDDSRRSSISSRRFSANRGEEEKVFQQKLLSLEAELIAERERASGLEKEVSAKNTSMSELNSQLEEVNSMKQDLSENFKAQQRDFMEERKSLEVEIKRLKARLEELEDEIDRYIGSRENEKCDVDDRVRLLQEELEKLRKDAAAEAQKAQGQVDFLRNDAKLQRETNESLERQMQSLREEKKELMSRTIQAESLAQDQLKALQDIHLQLSPKLRMPQEFTALSGSLTNKSLNLLSDLENTKRDYNLAKSQRDDAETTISELKDELTKYREKFDREEKASQSLREELASEKAKFSALEAELADERLQLSSLRTRMADGETGSEALRSRLEEEERKVTSLSEDLAGQLSRIGSLEEEMRSHKERNQFAQERLERLNNRFDSRTSRAKDLTQRLYSQNDKLVRLLERLSYSVTKENGSMIIQKLPKPDRSILNGNDSSDAGNKIRRSMTGSTTMRAMIDSGDLDLLYWMHNDDPEAEAEKYDAYINSIGSFDVDNFCEVIAKRVRDIEYTAKKYSKDARSYREKSHRAQKEAHEKIAFKNFKEGDLALFLPTRNQSTGAWAAFNVGAPHYFLREQDSHKLRSRDWLLARIHKIEDRVVDLSKSMTDGRSFASTGGDSFEDDNPFDLSDGLRWYLIDAAEEKPGAPSTPGLAKSTVASANIDATATIRRSKKSSTTGAEGLNKTLAKSLDSRRSSSNSKKAIPAASSPLRKTDSTASVSGLRNAANDNDVMGTGADSILVRNVDGIADGKANSEVRNPLDNLLGP